MVDVPLLRKVVDWVDEQDALAKQGLNSLWNQEAWFRTSSEDWLDAIRNTYAPDCGTGMCIAGKLVFDAGYEFLMVADTPESYYADRVVLPNGEVTFVDIAAQKLLGIGDYEANCLFDAENDARTIRAQAEDIALRAGDKL